MENAQQKIENLLSNPLLAPSARRFVISLKNWVEKKPLTRKQTYALNTIEQRYSSPQEVVDATWSAKYKKSKKMRQNAHVCAKYYEANPPYFADLIFRILNEEDFIPTEKQFNALTNNKYTIKILTAYYKTEDFSEGSYVYLRKSADALLLSEIGERPCLVLKANILPIVRARKGAKMYKIVPFGVAKVYSIEERDLKQANIKFS